MGVAIAAALVMLSFGCSLSHLRDPDHIVPKGLLAFLGVGALALVTKGVLFTFLVLQSSQRASSSETSRCGAAG